MIDPAKTYRTRDGREVRIYAVDGIGPSTVHGSIRDGDRWQLMSWNAKGDVSFATHPADLIECKPKHVRWVNVYEPTRVTPLYESKQEADTFAAPERLACIRIEFEEGEGL